MKPRYKDVLGALTESWQCTSAIAEQAGYSHLDARFALNALQHQGLVERRGPDVRLTEAGVRLKGRHVCIQSA